MAVSANFEERIRVLLRIFGNLLVRFVPVAMQADGGAVFKDAQERNIRVEVFESEIGEQVELIVP